MIMRILRLIFDVADIKRRILVDIKTHVITAVSVFIRKTIRRHLRNVKIRHILVIIEKPFGDVRIARIHSDRAVFFARPETYHIHVENT